MSDNPNSVGTRPRRTMIYVSGDIDRHLAKAPSLPADAIIYDLHEAVSAGFKERAREKLRTAVEISRYRGQEKVVRVNRLDSPWADDDLRMAAGVDVDAVLFTGIESGRQLLEAVARLDAAGGAHLPVMSMIETAKAVLNVQEIASASDRLVLLAVSTANLAANMRLPPSRDRTGLFVPLSQVVLAARAHGLCAIDGAHLDIKEPHACEYACRQSRDFGFDGKAVIHPVQLAYTNDAFSPKPKDVKKKREIVRLMEQARQEGRSYALLEQRLLQPSELEAARRCIAHYEAIERLNALFDGEVKG